MTAPQTRLQTGFMLMGLAAGAFLSACTPGRYDYVQVDSSYSSQEFGAVPYTKALKADVSGNPFGISKTAFEDIVDAAIQPPGIVKTDASPYRLHMAFNGPDAVGFGNACTAKGTDGPANGSGTDNRISITAAFCYGGRALTYLHGSIDDVKEPNDPRFQKFLRTTVVRLMPNQTMEDHGNQDKCLMPGC